MKYDIVSVGYFGLFIDFYIYFMLLICWYLDLIVYRLIREYLINGDVCLEMLEKCVEEFFEIVEYSLKMECCVVEVECEIDELKKMEFMVDKVGECFIGIISLVINFGLFIEFLIMIEGLVYVSVMKGDYFKFY